MWDIFLQKSYTKFGGEASPRPFYKKSKLTKYLTQQSEMFDSFFCMSKSRSTEIH